MQSRSSFWPAALAAGVAVALALVLLAARPAHAHHETPPYQVQNSAPGGWLLAGYRHDPLASSNQGTLDGYGGVQLDRSRNRARLWLKARASRNEVVARFSRLHFQFLNGSGHLIAEWRSDPERGPTHLGGPRDAYSVGGWHTLPSGTAIIRISGYVYARISGTFLEHRECVASRSISPAGASVAGPLC